MQSPFKLRNSEWCSVSSLTFIGYSCNEQRLWSDCAYAQANMSLCWSHIPHCWKPYALAHWSWSASEIRVRLVLSNMFKPSSNFLTDCSKALLLWILYVICVSYLSVILSCLFLAALWPPSGKGLTSWLSCMWCFLVFCHFPIWCPGSGVVFDCIDSLSLPSSLLLANIWQTSLYCLCDLFAPINIMRCKSQPWNQC